MAEVIRETPIAFENHVLPEEVPIQPLARWEITWLDPHVDPLQRNHDVRRETPPMTYRGVLDYARKRTRYYEGVTLLRPTQVVPAPELE